MASRINVERIGSTCIVSLARPDKRNAIDFDMMYQLMGAARDLKDDRELRAVIINGEGESFCAGLDFASVTSKPAGIAKAFIPDPVRGTNVFQETCWAWRRLSVPVIASLHGHCLGGGLQIALAADFRVAHPDCAMSVLEAKWGLIPDMSGSVSLGELMAPDKAKLLTMTGRVFDAREGEKMNLVTELADDPMATAMALADELAQRSPDSVAATKQLFEKTRGASDRESFAIERRLQTMVLFGKNQKRAMKAAFDKGRAKYGKRMRGL